MKYSNRDKRPVLLILHSSYIFHNSNYIYLSPGVAKKAVPALATGALSGLASTGVSKLFGNGLYLKKGGMIAQVETDGQGLYLRPYKGKGLSSHGNGLYLKQGKIFMMVAVFLRAFRLLGIS